MKALLLIVSIMVAVSSAAMADVPGKDWLTPAQVTEKLLGLGYTQIVKLEADDGHWEGDAVKDGKVYEVDIDPHSGAVIKSKLKD
jgi:hypothetical protein